MYYPKSQVITNQYSKGKLVIASTGETYIGDYWSTVNGKYFSGKSPNSLISPIELKLSPSEKINQESTQPDLQEQIYNIDYSTFKYFQLKGIKSSKAPGIPIHVVPTLTNKDYEAGEFTRFFCRKKNEGLFLEITQKNFNKLKGQDQTIAYDLYIPFTLSWVITGDKEQVIIENQKSVQYKESKENIQGLSSYIQNNYLEFYSLYTNGGEFTTPNGEPYKGTYHIHPTEGPMEGPRHSLFYHSKLVPTLSSPSNFQQSNIYNKSNISPPKKY